VLIGLPSSKQGVELSASLMVEVGSDEEWMGGIDSCSRLPCRVDFVIHRIALEEHKRAVNFA
jgi:hypothetical protein